MLLQFRGLAEPAQAARFFYRIPVQIPDGARRSATK